MNYNVTARVTSGSLISVGRAVVTTPSGHHVRAFEVRSFIPYTALLRARRQAERWVAERR